MHPVVSLSKCSIRNKKAAIIAFIFLNMFIIQSTVSIADIVDMEGDKDGFGVGCPIANGLNFTDYGSTLTDYREPSDPNFTDKWVDGVLMFW